METNRNIYLSLAELRRRYRAGQDDARHGPLTEFELRCFSQNGEDGIIAEILARIGPETNFFIEFGIENGREGNCVFLADVLDWGGLFLEVDQALYEDLARKYAAAGRITTLNAAVTPENVESLFADAGVPSEPDVLSIDADGPDYWIWDALEAYRPRLVVIEYNARLPPGRQLAQPRSYREPWGGTDYFGASLDALCALGERKGYRLVHTDLAGVNSFFVRSDLASSKFPPPDCVPRRHQTNYFMMDYRHPPGDQQRRYVDLVSGQEYVPDKIGTQTTFGLRSESRRFAQREGSPHPGQRSRYTVDVTDGSARMENLQTTSELTSSDQTSDAVLEATALPPHVTAATVVGPLLLPAGDPVMTSHITEYGSWEAAESAVLMTVIGPGDHVIDIGAHVGYMTLLAASRVTAAGSVLAIEANSDNFALLRANVERNTLTNVRPVEGAAWRQSDEELTMTVSPDNSGDHRVFQRDGAANTVQVRSVAVDDLITDDWRADVVKVDVQGTDHVAIEGMRRTIERFRPTLLVEFWPKGIEEFGGQADQVLAFYRELGYDLTILEVPTLSRDAALSRVVDAAWRCPWGYCTLLLQPHEKPE